MMDGRCGSPRRVAQKPASNSRRSYKRAAALRYDNLEPEDPPHRTSQAARILCLDGKVTDFDSFSSAKLR